MNDTSPYLLLVGCGKMGQALLSGWLNAGIAARIDIIEPSPDRPATLPHTVVWHDSAVDYLASQPPRPNAMVLAVKPQIMNEVCAPLVELGRDTLIVSIAAGRTLASFELLFGGEASVVRAMPNTPAAIGKGMTVAVAGRHVTRTQAAMADTLLRVTGTLTWIEQEYDLDAVTAVSGTGPAYVFLLTETLAKAGIDQGLSADLAARLARETVIGAGALLGDNTRAETVALRQSVTSPGGTTEAALTVLMAPDGLQRLMNEAVAAATKRSRDLKA